MVVEDNGEEEVIILLVKIGLGVSTMANLTTSRILSTLFVVIQGQIGRCVNSKRLIISTQSVPHLQCLSIFNGNLSTFSTLTHQYFLPASP